MKNKLRDKYPLYLANEPLQPNASLKVEDKYTGEAVTSVALADAEIIERAIVAADDCFEKMINMASYERQEVLLHCVQRFREDFDEFAYALCVEAGKPIRDSRGEVSRLIDTFKIAAEESTRIYGEIQPLDISERAKGYRGMWKRVPIGPCSFISPFNFPLNLAAHKIAPAIAAGCPFVMKPASKTPLGAILIGGILAETNLPKGAFSILPASRDGSDLFTTDERFKLLSFTGSPEVGWDLKARSGKKKVVLELGGNAAVIIDKDSDIDSVVDRVIFGAFYQSGQSCISVQRVIVHEKIYDKFKKIFVEKTKKLISGDPKLETTFIGPMISLSEAERLDEWIKDSLLKGAKVLCGGNRKDSMIEATILENVDRTSEVYAEEAFGPIAILSKFSNFNSALDEVNDSKFGLQAGIFTKNIDKAFLAWDKLEVGGIIIGDVPSYRVDNMPYGGVKDSGIGREGIKFAIEDMTEIRNLVIKT